jgi:HAD superfamily hydrolase (TIGR01459 family)
MNALTCLILLSALYMSYAHLHGTTRYRPVKSHESKSILASSKSSTDLVLEIPVLLRKIEEDFLDRYDCFLLDQFGVLHDGTNPLPGAIEIVRKLTDKGKKVIVTSNTSQRVKAAKAKWTLLGFPPVSDFITSGEFAYFFLKRHYHGKKAIIFGWRSQAGPEEYLQGTGIEILPADRVEEADVLIFQGSETMGHQDISLRETGELDDDVVKVMQAAADRGIPAVCCNQDLKALWTSGEHYMPGMLEVAYRTRFGGETMFYGKPDPEFFAAAVDVAMASPKGSYNHFADDEDESISAEEKFGRYAERQDGLECYQPDTIRQRRRKLAMAGVKAVHVGDSLHHDINGAVNAGIDVIFVSKYGVHKRDLYKLKDEDGSGETGAGVYEIDPKDLLNGTCDLCDRLGVLRPSYIVEAFSQ